MEKMKALNEDANKWLEKMPPNTWVRAYLYEFPKCDILLNNNYEVFNSYILEARELPILSMLERIKCQLMTKHYNKQQELGKDIQGAFCPKIRKKGCKKCRVCKYMFCFTIRIGCLPSVDKGLPAHSRHQCKDM